MASSGPRAAHLIRDLAPRLLFANGVLCANTENTPELQRLAREHANRIHRLLDECVFTHRVQSHEADQAEEIQASMGPDNSFGVISQQQLTYMGRSQRAEDNRTEEAGALEAAQLLFADIDEQLALKGRLDATEITSTVLAIEAELVLALEDLLGTQMKAPGLGQRTEHRVLSALDGAGKLLEMRVAPEKDVVASDMDGVLAVLRASEGHQGGPMGFRDTRLGYAVQQNAERLETELQQLQTGQANAGQQDTEMGLAPYFTQRYGALMEQQWGDEAIARIRAIYTESYPADRGSDAMRDAQAHIDRMPLAYHVFRHKTWDHTFEDVYEMDTTPGDFATCVIERGGRLVFITAAPKIHAIKMLKASGVMDAVGPDGFELFTVEDLYQEGTVEKRTFIEGDKGTLLAAWCEEHGIAKERVAMGGDQYHSDVEPVIKQGIQARVVNGPLELGRYLASIRLPRDKAV
jgi:hypothetical protein